MRPGFVATLMTEKVDGMFWLISADRAAELTIAAARKRKAVVYIPGRWRHEARLQAHRPRQEGDSRGSAPATSTAPPALIAVGRRAQRGVAAT